MRKMALIFGRLLGLSGTAHAAFIRRGTGGTVVGVFANSQPGIPEVRQVPDSDPRVLAFRQHLAKIMAAARSAGPMQWLRTCLSKEA